MGLVLAEITMDVEDTFEVQLPDSAAYHLQTAGDLRRLTLEQLDRSRRLIRMCVGGGPALDNRSGKRCWTGRQVWAKLREIIHRTGDVPLERITHNARLIEDLGLD